MLRFNATIKSCFILLLLVLAISCKKKTTSTGFVGTGTDTNNASYTGITDLIEKIEAQAGDNDTKIKELSDQLKKETENRKAADQQIMNDIAALEKRITDRLTLIDTQLDDLKKVDEELKKEIKENKEAIKENKEAIEENKKDLAAFKNHVATTYASKTELETQKKAVKTLDTALQLLRGDFTDYKRKMTVETEKIKNELITKITALDTRVTNLEDEFKKHLDDYQAEKQKMQTELESKITKLETDMLTKTDLEQSLTAIKDDIANLQIFEKEINQKFAEQSQQISKNTADMNILGGITDALLKSKKQDADTREQVKQLFENLMTQVDNNTRKIADVEGMAKANSKRLALHEERINNLKNEVTRFKDEFDKFKKKTNTSIASVRDLSLKMLSGLTSPDNKFEDSLGIITTRYAEYASKIGSAIMKLGLNLGGLAKGKLEEIAKITKTTQESLGESITEFMYITNNMNLKIINAIQAGDPNGVSKDFDKIFREKVTKVCVSGQENKKILQADNASALGMEWVIWISKIYMQELLFGNRSNNESIMKIFFNKAALKVNSLASGIMRTLIGYQSDIQPDIATMPKCVEAATQTARELLFSEIYQAVRDRIAAAKENKTEDNSASMGDIVNLLYRQAMKITTHSTDLKEKIKETFITKWKEFTDGEKFEKFWQEGNEKSENPVYLIAAQMIEFSTTNHYYKLYERQYKEYVAIAENFQKFWKNQKQQAKDISDLKAQVDQQIADLTQFKQESRTVDVTILHLIDALARRMDPEKNKDIIEKVQDTISKLGGKYAPISKPIQAKCEQIHLVFGTNLRTGQEDRSCLGVVVSLDSGKYITDFSGATAVYPKATEMGTPCSVNYDYVATRIRNNALLTDARIRVYGSFNKIESKGDNNKAQEVPILDNDKFRIAGNANYGVYDYPVSWLMAQGKQGPLVRKIQIATTVYGDNNTSHQCPNLAIDFHSPIVLHFQEGMISTLPPSISKAKFDINTSGKKSSLGWVDDHVGFLVFDRNNNGYIDDASEMFGNKTRLKNNRLAENGYIALREYDENQNNQIDPEDSIYHDERLLIWIDQDGNGNSEENELFSLENIILKDGSRTQVTAIDLEYLQVAENKRYQYIKGLEIFANDVRYQSRFYGPQNCGPEGCSTFDVFFGTLDMPTD